MAVKTADRTFLQGQSVDLFRAAIKSQATRDPYERRLIGFLKRMDAESPDAFVKFARNNPVHTENKIIAFLSSERARADHGEISAGTINNWVATARLFLNIHLSTGPGFRFSLYSPYFLELQEALVVRKPNYGI